MSISANTTVWALAPALRAIRREDTQLKTVTSAVQALIDAAGFNPNGLGTRWWEGTTHPLSGVAN